MKLIFTDAKTIGDDIDLSGYDAIGDVIKHDFMKPEEAADALEDADIIVTNKVPMNAQTLAKADHVKLICVTATGTNNLDKDYLASRNIDWRNVADYSTNSVAQHTFAMLFYLYEKLRYYDDYVKSGRYVNDNCFTHFSETFTELVGKTWGIIGLGNIGRRVAGIARAFGCRVIYYSASGGKAQEGYEQVDFDTILSTSDILSIHAPLNAFTENLMNRDAFARMKPSAILLNLGRGPIVVEQDLADALQQNAIAAAGLDVLCTEPMTPDNPLLSISDSRRLFITPHIGWASVEARTNLMHIILEQIKDWKQSHL